MKIKKQQTKKGSILVFALILFSMMLMIAIGITNASLKEKKNVLITDNSNQAFQMADTIAEGFKSKAEGVSFVSQVVSSYTCNANGKLTGYSSAGSKNPYTITMYDSVGAEYACNNGNVGITLMSTIKRIKIVSTFNGTVRATDVTINTN